MSQSEKTPERGGFVQYPCQLIYNCPELNRDDKWVLLSIMGVCWTEGPYRLSYRDIAALSGVPISLLSSVAAKNGKPAKEGIMDRLKRLEYVRCVMGKDKDTTTGKAKGNAQTYIYVNYQKIWGESTAYKGEAYKVKENYEPVPNTNTPVSYTNRFVPNTNTPVPNTNEPVRDSRSKVGTYITYINLDNVDKEDGKDTAMSDDNRNTSSSFSQTLVPHPQHHFLWFDDLLTPSIMVIRWTPAWPSRYSSEMEDKRRVRIAEEVMDLFQARGLKVAVRREHETEQEIEQALAENENKDEPTGKSVEVHRLTSDTTPSSPVQVERDKAPRRIERETANRTPGLPVVEAAKSIVIHENMQSTTTSYSPQNTATSTTEEVTLDAPVVEQQQTGKGKGSKPKKTEDTTIAARVERVYAYLDILAKEITGVPDFHYTPNKTSTSAIKTWLKGNPTEELLREVFLELWNSPPDPRTGFSWQNNMKIPSILREYDSRVLAIKARRRKQQQASNIVTTASHIAGYANKPDLDDEDPVYLRKEQKNSRKRA